MNDPIVIWSPDDVRKAAEIAARFPAVDVEPAPVIDIRSGQVIA